ncbi:hypothetical protein GOODEAATRI_032359 [Goodea atripinnis]|uniref:Uncharacterized protein n=1 Tax=Goodea atripinnis TaxID=208336 RepID=A0ABV0NZL7_9TELE
MYKGTNNLQAVGNATVTVATIYYITSAYQMLRGAELVGIEEERISDGNGILDEKRSQWETRSPKANWSA